MNASFLKPFAPVLLLAITSGCGWLAPEKPSRPVAELKDIANPVQAARLWSRDTGKGGEGTQLTPALQGGRLYVADAAGAVMSCEASSGNLIWSADLDTDITGGVGVGAGLVFAGTANGRLVALDAATGAERWSSQLSSEVLSVPVAAQNIVVVRTSDGKIVGLDAVNGGEVWSYEREVPVLSLRGSASPVIVDGQALCGLDGGRLVNLDLMSGQPVWDVAISYPTGRTDLERVVDIDAPPLVVGQSVFVASFQGAMAALDLATGGRGWTRPFSTYTPLAAGPQGLYASDEYGHVWAIMPSTGETLWQQKALSGRLLSAPAVVGRWLVVGDLEGYVHWLDSATGEVVGRTEAADSRIVAQPLVQGDQVFVMASEGELIALRAP